MRRPHLTGGRPREPGGHVEDPCALVDDGARSLGGAGDPGHEPGRLHARTVGCVERADAAIYGHALLELCPAQQLPRGLLPGPLTLVIEFLAQPRELQLALRDDDRPALAPIAIDLLALDRRRNLRETGLNRTGHRQRRVAAATALPGRRATGDLTAHPAAVATGCTEAHMLGFEHHDRQRRVGAAELVREPRAREAGTDDAHVGRVRSTQGWSAGFRLELVKPEGRCC